MVREEHFDLSIVIPTFNREETIRHCVRTAQQQCEGTAEVIVVDDGSTDATLDLLAQETGKIRILTQNHKGACAARNAGLLAAKGDSIVFLDSDDYYVSDLAGTLHRHRVRENIDMAIGFHSLDRNGEVQRVEFLRPGDNRERILEMFSDGWIVQTAAICWRREFIKKIGGWDPSVLQWQDVDLYLRALFHGAETAVFSEDGAVVREYLDRTRISHKVDHKVIRSQLAFIDRLGSLSSPATHKYVSNIYYKLARHAFRHHQWEAGRTALENARKFGLTSHRGSRKHRLLSSFLGLERKERLSTFLRPVPFTRQARVK